MTPTNKANAPPWGWSLGQLRSIHVGYGVLAMLLIGLLAFAILQPIQVLPRMGLGPGFSLVDQAGQRLTNEDLRGHLVLYTFTYTGCQAGCPQTSYALQRLQAQLGGINMRGLPVDLVTISFDPARDTSPQLLTFAQGLGADLSHWHFVTGEPAAVKNVIGGSFGIYYTQEDNGLFTFDPAFVLVDGTGLVRAKYRTADLDLAIVQRDLELIATEVAHSQGAARLAYEAAHLFLCYPK